MTWWLIGLLLLAAFGPVLWIMPSSRDRLLTRLRAGARSRGLLVELSQLPDLAAPVEARVTAGGKRREPTMPCTAYRQPLPRAVKHAPRWRLLSFAAGTDPVRGWTFDGESAGGEAYWAAVEELLADLPDWVVGVELGRSDVAIYWRERVAIEAIDTVLDELAGVLERLAKWHQEVEQNALDRVAAGDLADD